MMENRHLRIATLFIVCLLFAGAYEQLPLFSYNQNTYFLVGLANAGYGNLSADWLALQTDHIPVFSALVSIVHNLNNHWLLYVFYGVILAIYALSLFALLSHPSLAGPRIHQTVLFFAFLVLIHSPWLVFGFLSSLFPNLGIITNIHTLAILLTKGLANQYILGAAFQPSVFGVLLVTSIALFIYKKEYWAIGCAVLAATIHPTYVLHAGVLTAVYMAILVFEAQRPKALKAGALAFLLVLPVLLFVFFVFQPTSATALQAAQTVLADKTIPFHANIFSWFSIKSFIQLAAISFGLVLVRHNKRLFRVLLFSSLAGIALTLLQMISGSKTLALLFPWRLSAWLVPISTAAIAYSLSALLSKVINSMKAERSRNMTTMAVTAVSIAFLVVAFILGISRTADQNPLDQEQGKIISFAKERYNPNQRYLVPPNYQDFRMNSGIPIFVDWKSHPYKDVEVIEWYERLQLAESFYAAEETELANAIFMQIQSRESITHIVIEKNTSSLKHLENLRLVYQDDNALVYEVFDGNDSDR